jgi:hypothetical protein
VSNIPTIFPKVHAAAARHAKRTGDAAVAHTKEHHGDAKQELKAAMRRSKNNWAKWDAEHRKR